MLRNVHSEKTVDTFCIVKMESTRFSKNRVCTDLDLATSSDWNYYEVLSSCLQDFSKVKASGNADLLEPSWDAL